MKHGFIRAAAMTPVIRVADCQYNTDRIIEQAKEAYSNNVRLVVFPEMCITGYTCNDLFLQEELIRSAKESLVRLVKQTRDLKGMLIFAGLPYEHDCKLYNVAAAICDGKILGLVPKRYLPNYGEFYERRQFTPGFEKTEWTRIDKL